MRTEFALKAREIELKERQISDEMTMKALKEVRDDFDALTRRVVALGNAGPSISIEQIQPLVKQVIAEALINGGELVETPGSVEGGTPSGLPEGGSEEQDSLPGVPGSREVNGRHFVPNPEGGWLEAVPNDQADMNA